VLGSYWLRGNHVAGFHALYSRSRRAGLKAVRSVGNFHSNVVAEPPSHAAICQLILRLLCIGSSDKAAKIDGVTENHRAGEEFFSGRGSISGARTHLLWDQHLSQHRQIRAKSYDLLDSKACPNRQGMFSCYTSAISTESCLTSFRNLRLSTLDSLASHWVITYFHCPQCEFTNLCGGLKDSVSLYMGSSARDKQLLASLSIVPEKP
jgi:hypothetical protein